MPDASFSIRAATAADAEPACALLRRSIAVLCHADHDGDPDRIAAWLANKTPAAVGRWIAAGSIFLATGYDRILGVGGVTRDGRITLMYVAPEARFQGVSKALLAHMEAAARAAGCHTLTLESTCTAARFYHDAGYRPDGPTGASHRLTLAKALD